MTRVVVDASALAALVFGEPGASDVAAALVGREVYAPHLLRFELANVAWKKARRRSADAAGIFTALSVVLEDRDLVWRDVDAVDVAIIAHATGLTAYDASYLWLAGTLGADLVTLDSRLARAAEVV